MTYPATVTLKQLMKEGACVAGYNKVVYMLKGAEYNDKDEYIKFDYDGEILITDILKNNGLYDAIWCSRFLSGRDARLFAVWCARQVQHLMTDERSINALDVAEKYANGNASSDELDDARAAASAAASAAARDAASAAARAAARDAASAAARAAARDAIQEMYTKVLNGDAPWQVK